MNETPRVVVGISTAETARWALFYDAFIHLRYPFPVQVIQARGANIAENRNLITKRALELGATHIWYVDDDQVFMPDTVATLLAADKDVVSGLYLTRAAPFFPQMYDREDERGYVSPKLLGPDVGGLQQVLATGAGCLMVKAHVLAALEPPYWTLGQLNKEGWSDDVDFCRRVRAKGFEIWCDTDLLVGHMVSGVLWPQRLPTGDWISVIAQNNAEVARFAAVENRPTLVKV